MLKSYFVFAFVLAQATALMYMQKTPVSRRVPVSVSATTKQELKDIDKKIFIFGLGYVGTALALKLKSLGWKVAGTTTNVNKVKILREQGLQTFLFDDTTSASLQKDAVEDIMSSRYILSTIPPASTKGDDCVLSAFGDEIRRAAINNDLRWIGYLSSTGVYGDRQGSWVSEEDIPQPSNERTKARALAESRWTTLYERNGIPVHLFRLAGIYGTGRSALDTVRKAKGSIDQCGVDDLKFVSRIHVDDIVSIVLASMLFPSPGEVYNVADDLPSTRYDVLAYAAKVLGYPVVRLDPNADSRYYRDSGAPLGSTRGGSKRVDNRKMRALLETAGFSVAYPDFRSGINAILEEEKKLGVDESVSLDTVDKKFTSDSNQNGLPNQTSTATETSIEERLTELENKVKRIEGILSATSKLGEE